MLIIGLTGPSGSGKGTVASIFEAHGIPTVDTDQVYHDLLTPPSPCLDELTARFGHEILDERANLDRKALAAMVFAPGRESAREDLNHITHKYVLEKVRDICHALDKNGSSAVVVDAPLLFESGFDRECHYTLAVIATYEQRLARIMERDGMTYEAAHARLRAQKPDEFYIRQADHVILNNGSRESLSSDVLRFLADRGMLS